MSPTPHGVSKLAAYNEASRFSLRSCGCGGSIVGRELARADIGLRCRQGASKLAAYDEEPPLPRALHAIVGSIVGRELAHAGIGPRYRQGASELAAYAMAAAHCVYPPLHRAVFPIHRFSP